MGELSSHLPQRLNVSWGHVAADPLPKLQNFPEGPPCFDVALGGKGRPMAG